MKTPREILFARHQSANLKLDALRREVISGLPATGQHRPTESTASLFTQIWHELIQPCRRIWTGLAAVWLCLIIFNLSQSPSAHPMMANTSSATESATAFRDQQRMLNELLADRVLPVEAVRPRSYAPKPRSEAVEFLTT
jgi:hypothetical protein